MGANTKGELVMEVEIEETNPEALKRALALPAFKDVTVPLWYMRAKQVLEECEHLDDMTQYKSQAELAASYARQIADGSLLEAARRLTARTWRKMGEALEHIADPNPPSRKVKLKKALGYTSARRVVAKAAGLSDAAATKALKIASIPRRDFENVVEQPGSCSGNDLLKIANAGANPNPQQAVQNLRRTHARAIHDFSELLARHEARTIARLFSLEERASLTDDAVAIRDWMNALLRAL